MNHNRQEIRQEIMNRNRLQNTAPGPGPTEEEKERTRQLIEKAHTDGNAPKASKAIKRMQTKIQTKSERNEDWNSK
jgi:hypothetical protein